MNRSLLLCLIGGLSLGASPAFAQQNAQTRHGFWFNIGLGYGSLGCQDCGGRTGGLRGGPSPGGPLSSKLLPGGCTTRRTQPANGSTPTRRTSDGRLPFYP